MPKIDTLVKIAAIGGIVTTGTGYFFRHLYYERIRKTKTYQEALEIVRKHGKTIEHLGEPIKEGRIQMLKSLSEDIRTFSVNLKGSKTGGKLHCEVLLKKPERKPEISKLEIKFANVPNKIFVIQQLS